VWELFKRHPFLGHAIMKFVFVSDLQHTFRSCHLGCFWCWSCWCGEGSGRYFREKQTAVALSDNCIHYVLAIKWNRCFDLLI